MKYPIYITLFLSALFLTFSPSLKAGGGWPQPKNKGYFKISEWWIIADQHYTSSGLIDPNVTAGLFNTTLYAEYGITNRLTTTFNMPIFARAYVNNVRSETTNEIIFQGDAINGIGDADVGLKYGIYQSDRVAISLGVIAGFALGESAGGTEGNLQLGDGEHNQQLRLDVGIPLPIGYANVYGGYNNRTKGFSDEYRFGGEFGIGLFKDKLWLAAKTDVVRSTFNGNSAGQNTTSVFANNSEFVSVSIEASYFITKKFGVSANYAGAVQGKIIYAAPSYSVGVFYKM